ncbi:MAG TPA: transglycosylase SLT domain-containing protein [Kofleriaceae bacterium]|nr:transglycosylase SLT domain-containing protein [Kofleriaceae bacterium]
MRGATVALLTAALIASVARPAAAGGGAAALGAAYRAFAGGDYRKARALAAKIDRGAVKNKDYVAYLAAQSAYLSGDLEAALRELQPLAADKSSRFRAWAAWRVADTQWALGRRADARKSYTALIKGQGSGDEALAKYRVAEADAAAGKTAAAVRALQALRREHPGHMLDAVAATRLIELGGARADDLDAGAHIARAVQLKLAKKWDLAVAELHLVADSESTATRRQRDFWLAMTLFKMRRQYQRASDILLGLYEEMGDRAAEALFHGARALSRADHDPEAIVQYQKLVATYPRSDWAAEAQFLSGWLWFNEGRYKEALPNLLETRRRFGRTKFGDDALWYIAYSHYLLGDLDKALPLFDELSRRGDRLEGGKGQYWHARSLQKLGKEAEAVREYRGLVGRFPLSWYALLARARLAERGDTIDPFGDSPRSSDAAAAVATVVDEKLASDPLIARVDELTAAGLGVEAGEELERGEKGFLKRHPRAAALALVLDRYRKAGNFHRPWMLAASWGGNRAFDAPPKGPARVWWEASLPLAYRDLVDKHRALGGSPDYYLWAIMRKESGFDPHVHSYADAIGLLQMIPPTTRKVAPALGLTYTDDLLFDPELNIKTGSWYIGKLLAKFKGQIPLGAGSFNSGPRPVMRWIDENGDRPMDELVELVAYTQTREYMKKVTEIYARYVFFYDQKIYEQPLTVDKTYVKDELIY